MSKLFANLIAICVMGVLAYLFFSNVPSFKEYVPPASAIATGSCGLFAICVWKFSPADECTIPVLWFLALAWGMAIVFFVLACGLAGISIGEGVALPNALWASPTPELVDWGRHRLFWLAMFFGPGITLSIIGTGTRYLLLRLNRRH